MPELYETAVFGGGCFWCTEAVFKELRGVISVMPGYAGGPAAPAGAPAPTYEAVCTGTTGHAEAIRIEFDPKQVTFNDLLTIFFATHDPTTLNRQGNDVGTQYRSIVLYTTPEQRDAATAFIKKLTDSDPGGRPVVTEIKPLDKFYEAESYHQDYFAKNPNQPYCQLIIEPKVEKLQKEFAELLAKKSN
jgi:peptide-methionine (S)-S-oxide reductase